LSDKPNILINWGDDIGQRNLSCYSDGVMGYRTPNIDRIAGEGARFTDYYGEQNCTAGRAALMTGQNPYRTGLTKVGMPGAPLGLQAELISGSQRDKRQPRRDLIGAGTRETQRTGSGRGRHGQQAGGQQ
jgi:Sulfatase